MWSHARPARPRPGPSEGIAVASDAPPRCPVLRGSDHDTLPLAPKILPRWSCTLGANFFLPLAIDIPVIAIECNYSVASPSELGCLSSFQSHPLGTRLSVLSKGSDYEVLQPTCIVPESPISYHPYLPALPLEPERTPTQDPASSAALAPPVGQGSPSSSPHPPHLHLSYCLHLLRHPMT